MKGQIQTQKYGFIANFAPKNIVILHISSTQKMGDNFILVIDLIAKELFLRCYIIELRENGNCWNFLPQKMQIGSSCEHTANM